MKVINKSAMNKQIKCECNALLEYTAEDIKTGEYGCAYIICPECKCKIFLEDEVGKSITINNIEFPNDFTIAGGKEVADLDINNWIKQCLSTLDKDEEDYGVWAHTGTGNALVFCFKYEDEYAVYVTRAYQHTVVPREV